MAKTIIEQRMDEIKIEKLFFNENVCTYIMHTTTISLMMLR